jgi:hypothetical protein
MVLMALTIAPSSKNDRALSSKNRAKNLQRSRFQHEGWSFLMGSFLLSPESISLEAKR